MSSMQQHNMAAKILAAGFLASIAVVVSANQAAGVTSSFPFSNCSSAASAYSLAPSAKIYGTNNTFCFTLAAKQGTSGYCDTKADVYKIEINVKPTCDLGSVTVQSTLNGKPTAVSPAFSYPPGGPAVSVVLRLTQLGLGLNSTGSQICITLSGGRGCTTLEQLCQPPPELTAGAPLTGPPSPPPSVNPVSGCKVCAYMTLYQDTAVDPNFRPMTMAECYAFGYMVINDVSLQADFYSAILLDGGSTVACTDNQAKACVTFASNSDGEALRDSIEAMAEYWLSYATSNYLCVPRRAVTVVVDVGGDIDPVTGMPSDSCLAAHSANLCG
ncbi:hypothetical protein VOLCADRAFT_106278 [Volvox carteri f. nagariensis]|uniref:Pherophorin domain-containing protein n=1 Tax=Volvox carteri f. nagariensis TaxID=3068 RepID=D8U6B5_VOLCA|nr:uncharacterized protein VOLCADRAFT_106278 [Volvox carteri f. nagariensis]EFJ44618.1 hypothetical protein VOLCADRAFT_106278 [Volvox carteri f. nagariensis]|eukprot:XP_002954194.1 hypothetical protein VOLCADRAFT_106278 [Volvox carteri f. nagariensis]